MSQNIFEKEHCDFIILEKNDLKLWDEGINIIREEVFCRYVERMLQWMKDTGNDRCYIIAHDGTITAYRQALGEHDLTRADFLGEAGTFTIKV